ncbi:MAG: hypothetical protein KME49_26515 [Brasilonema octagenarum HA4186-MV1]|nr:hypothetical protein [Brasilonema octagenarum HA4186-MV1]
MPPQPKVVVEAQGSLEYLERRYRVTRQAIFHWRRFLGFPTETNKHYYSPEEVQALDYYYAGAHIPHKGKHWGLQMGRSEYERLILNKGIDFDEYLQITYSIDYQQFLENKHRQWQENLFGN